MLKKRFRSAFTETKFKMLYQYKLGWVYGSLLWGKNHLLGARIRIEASSLCQLNCPVCPTAKGITRQGTIGRGFLKLDNFKKFVDETPQVKTIELSNWGEVFLNPELSKIIKYAYDKGVKLTTVTGTNMNNIKDEAIEALVKYRFHSVFVSLDGASQETYSIYRRKGNFDTVINNIEKINHFKRKYGTNLPDLVWQFVIFGHNEHEIPKARKMAEKLGMTFRPILNAVPNYSPVQDEDFVLKVAPEIEATSQAKVEEKRKRAFSRVCGQLWDWPQINWDGKLLGCCENTFGDFGNVFTLDLKEALNGESYKYAKRMVQGLDPPREDIPCTYCDTYRFHNLGMEKVSLPIPLHSTVYSKDEQHKKVTSEELISLYQSRYHK